jgi:DNA-binding Lrp family transcriptional regulator
MLSKHDKQIIAAIQGDIPVCKRPYEKMARQIGISEQEFCAHLQSLNDRGIIRRFGATLKHQKSGYTSNAMTAWIVDESQVIAVGQMMAQSPHISHCYRRDPTKEWPYNLYTMIHGTSDSNCKTIAASLSQMTGVKQYEILFSQRELKKTSMKYYPDLAPKIQENEQTP